MIKMPHYGTEAYDACESLAPEEVKEFAATMLQARCSARRTLAQNKEASAIFIIVLRANDDLELWKHNRNGTRSLQWSFGRAS